MTLTGNTTLPTSLTINPRLDGLTTTTLKSFNAAPSGSVNLIMTASGLQTGDLYSFAVMGTKKTTSSSSIQSMTGSAITGVKNSIADTISAIPASSGFDTQNVSSKVYYTSPVLTWGTDLASRTFTIQVPAGTATDVYSLTAQIVGSNGSAVTYGREELFLNVAPVPEPSTIAMLLTAFGGLAIVWWKRRGAK